MELKHIPLDQLHISPFNMRHQRKAPDTADILPSIRARGILQPLLVRANNQGFEIVAGRRRFFSAKEIEMERGSFDPVPCAVMDDADDASALEASLIENIARLDPDEISQYETFTRLIKEGRSTEGIAATFGISEITVKQRLALGNLLPKIREAYRAEQVDGDTLRYLTMATKTQQKAWLALFESGDNVPFGHQLKQWLFGGQSISTKAALFPLDQYTGQIVTDLFGDDCYFADSDQFWQLQTRAVEAKREALLAARWSEVVVLETGSRFDQWDHEKTAKKRGGKAFITVSHRGEVYVHEGWLSRKEAKRANGKDETKPDAKVVPTSRPGMTQAMDNYLNLHRHAAVRLSILKSPDTALRLLVAHAMTSSGNWNVKPDPQRSRSPEIAASLAENPAQAKFEVERQAVSAILAIPNDWAGGDEGTVQAFARLLSLTDAKFLRVAAFVMADTLAAGSMCVEAAGQHLQTDPSAVWKPDDVFFGLIRDRAALTGMVAEVAGKPVAKANAGEKASALKQIIRDCIAGKNGRAKVEGWLTGWMAFPFQSFGGQSTIATNSASATKLLRKG